MPERMEEAEKVREILSVVSERVPTLIRGIIETMFSEKAGREMGKAIGAFYSELKDGGIPDEIAIKMTKDCLKSFTNMGELFRELKK